MNRVGRHCNSNDEWRNETNQRGNFNKRPEWHVSNDFNDKMRIML